MDELIAFVKARLDEDEAAAMEALQETTGRWTACETGWQGGPVVNDECGALILPAWASGLQYPHIARHDPARVLREVAAKRAIVDEHSPHYPVMFPQPSGQPTCTVCDEGGFDPERVDWPCPTVRHIAAVWSDHPDYRQEWAPEP